MLSTVQKVGDSVVSNIRSIGLRLIGYVELATQKLLDMHARIALQIKCVHLTLLVMKAVTDIVTTTILTQAMDGPAGPRYPVH